jgi:hypothetical protein
MLIMLPITINGLIEKLIICAVLGPDTEMLLPIPFNDLNGYWSGDAGTVPEFLTKAK